jgi:AcrR family transcriptional regulator
LETRIAGRPATLRKSPRQQRSRAMVATILEAAARVLARRGWAKFTTNEVAAVAGISVGSLYQYFPNKLALAEALRERHLGEVLAALPEPGGGAGRVSLALRVARLVEGVIAAHSVDPALHRILLGEVPLVDRAVHEAFEVAYRQRYLGVIQAPPGMRDEARDAMAAAVLATAVEGVVHAAARTGTLASPLLPRELEHLVRGYLRERARAR